MTYRCEAKSVIGFVQQLASNYLPHGYWFYVTGVIPDGKDPRDVDRKLLAKYGIDISRQARCRRKLRAGRIYTTFARAILHPTRDARRAYIFYRQKEIAFATLARRPSSFPGYSLSVVRGQFLKKEDGQKHAEPDRQTAGPSANRPRVLP